MGIITYNFGARTGPHGTQVTAAYGCRPINGLEARTLGTLKGMCSLLVHLGDAQGDTI